MVKHEMSVIVGKASGVRTIQASCGQSHALFLQMLFDLLVLFKCNVRGYLSLFDVSARREISLAKNINSA